MKTFVEYLDSLYGENLSIHPDQVEQINELVNKGVVFEIDKDSWIVINEDAYLNTKSNVVMLNVISTNNSPYYLRIVRTNINRFTMPV